MTLAHYLLQVNIYLVIFYCFYRLLLASETYFLLNRIYLLTSGILSLTIPFLKFDWFNKQEVARSIVVSVGEFKGFVSQVDVIEQEAADFNWGNLIVLIYLSGILFFTVRLISQLLAVRKIFRTITSGMAFSFLRKKVVDINVPQLAVVSLHEDIHIKQLHTVDVLFFELIGIFTWFNPIVYAYKKTIKNIHEYLADEASAKFQGDKEAYALLLLSQAFGVQPSAITNGFFTKSLIKKRIMMLHKQRSKKAAILKYGLFVPLFAVALVFSSATISKNKRILQMAEQLPLNRVTAVVTQAVKEPLSIVNIAPVPALSSEEAAVTTTENTFTAASSETNNGDTDASIEFNNFYRHLADRIKYPSTAVAKKLQGNTVINFTIRDGKISNAVVLNELGEGCDDEVVAEILAYNNFIPKDGNYSLKVEFKLHGADTEMKNADVADDPNIPSITVNGYLPVEPEKDAPVYNFVTVSSPPTYPGGMTKFYKFLGENIKYPAQAVDNEVEGSVYISFTVEIDGSLSNIKVDRKLGFGTDEEAIRVMKTSRRWLAGNQNGKPVRVKYNIPVKFSLKTPQNAKPSNVIASFRSKMSSDKDVPLVVFDGEVMPPDYLKTMDRTDIASVDIIRGPQAADIYGKAAENGAIVIKSKAAKAKEVTATLNLKN